MSSEASQLSRYRPAVIAVTGLTAICGIYALYSIWSSPPKEPSLQRSNAIRRQHRRTHSIERHPPGPGFPLGRVVVKMDRGPGVTLDLSKDRILSSGQLHHILDIRHDRLGELYPEIVDRAVYVLLDACRGHLAGDALPESLRSLCDEFSNARSLEDLDSFVAKIAGMLGVDNVSLVRICVAKHLNTMSIERLDGTNEDAAEDELHPSANALKGILYYIAEEQAKRSAYHHRGIRCDECGENPIRNVRWHCLNCPDFELCSTCKALTAHQRNHVFAEIKIPIPQLAQPVGILPIWYPGSPDAPCLSLLPHHRKRLAQSYGFQETEIDALYDQFVCLANVVSPSDPVGIMAAIDRKAFTEALTSQRWRKRFKANILYDRMFAFYDTGSKGSVGFEEFVSGISYLRGDKRFEPLQRAVMGYDLRGDGLVAREDMLRLLRAKFELHRLIVEDLTEAEEGIQTRMAMEILQSNQPVSSTFQEDIPIGSIRPVSGKYQDMNGDALPTAWAKTVVEDDNDLSYGALRHEHPHWVELGDNMRNSHDGALDMPPDGQAATDSTEPSRRRMFVDGLDPEELEVLGLGNVEKQRVQRSRNANQDVLWHIIEQGINETLDMLFEDVESKQDELRRTEEERRRWRTEIDEIVRQSEEFERELDHHSQVDPLMATMKDLHRRGSRPESEHDNGSGQDGYGYTNRRSAEHEAVVSTDTASLERMESEISRQPLQELLKVAGYGLKMVEEEEGEGESEEAGDDTSGEVAVRVPTMPQHKPNTTSSSETLTRTDAATGKGEGRGQQDVDRRRPALRRLQMLADMEADAQHIVTRNGRVCLKVEEIEGLADADPTGEVRGLIRSWLDWASF